MDKTLISVPLTDLATGDREGLGSIFRRDGKVYRWVKNAGATALVRDGCCLTMITSVEGNAFKRVKSPDGAGAKTAPLTMPAGVPMSNIGASGSNTGAYGWIQVAGPRKVSIIGTGADSAIGYIAVATSQQPATAPWASPLAPTADSGSTAYAYAKKVVVLSPVSDEAATADSAIVDIQCL